MDSVELPLQANVTVGKLTASEGLDRVGESEPKNSAAVKEGHVLREGSGCGPCRKEHSSLSGSRKVDEDSSVHENLSPHLQCGEDSKRYDMKVAERHIPLSPNHEGKLLGRKYAKKQSGIPSKLPRAHDSENYMKNTRTDGHESISNKAGFDPIRCTFADKPQLIEQKRVHEGKKTDRKHFRASLKNKYESLTSKAGLVCNDALFSGNNILGTHGLKSDLLDITKNLDDLSIFELLDGSYKYPKLTPDKGKRYSNVNDNVLLLVRKACSVLCPPPHGLAENAGNIKSLQNSHDHSFSAGSSSDCETKEKNLEESFIKVKADGSGQANWIEPTMFQPKNILDQLALPAAHELEAFLFNQSITSIPIQCTAKVKSCVSTSLPPFSWSFSHGGNSKPSVEVCKVNQTKNLYHQGKWVRIGCSSTLTEDDKSFLSGSVFKACGQDVDFINQQKINDVLQVVNSFTSTLQPPSDGLSNKSSVIGTHADVPVPETMSSSHGSGIPGSFNSKTSTVHEISHSLRSHPLECSSKDHASQETTASQVVSVCQGTEMNLDPSKFHIKMKDKAILTECTTGFDDCSASCSCRTMNAGSACSSWQLSTCEKYRQAYSPELLYAAEVLCEMANSDLKKDTKNSSGRIRWPKPPSMKTMKARKCSLTLDKPDSSITPSGCNDLVTKSSKSSPSLDKANRSCMAAGRNGSVTQPNMPSPKHRPTSERKTDFIRYASAKVARWSSVSIGAASSPNKLEKDHNQKSPNGNNSFRPLTTQLSSRADKAYDSQIRKAAAKTPSVTVEGSPIRDWVRDRNKRL